MGEPSAGFDGAMMRAQAATYFVKAISRLFPAISCRIPAAGKKRVVLTFDDGPTPEGTCELRDVLAQHGVRALFFVVGENAAAHPEQVRALVADGHMIGNHSQTHIDAWRATPRRVRDEMSSCATLLEELTGRPVDWLRPPYGRVTLSLVTWCQNSGQRMLLWDVMPPDFNVGVSPEQVAEHLENQIRPGSVICLHDNSKARPVTAAALRISLPRLLADGWEFCLPAA
jgi:peptidoglycan-N-acetylglucosamine deacetylase